MLYCTTSDGMSGTPAASRIKRVMTERSSSDGPFTAAGLVRIGDHLHVHPLPAVSAGVVGSSVSHPDALGEGTVQQDEVRIGLTQDPSADPAHVRRTGGRPRSRAGAGEELADPEPGTIPTTVVYQSGVSTQGHQCHHHTLGRAELAAPVAPTGDDAHRHPLHKRIRQVEGGRTDDQQGPRAAWLKRQTSRSTARGPHSSRSATLT
jgi:hypothetical protein